MTGDTLTHRRPGCRSPARTAAAKLIVVVRAPDAADYDRVLDVLVDGRNPQRRTDSHHTGHP